MHIDNTDVVVKLVRTVNDCILQGLINFIAVLNVDGLISFNPIQDNNRLTHCYMIAKYVLLPESTTVT